MTGGRVHYFCDLSNLVLVSTYPQLVFHPPYNGLAVGIGIFTCVVSLTNKYLE